VRICAPARAPVPAALSPRADTQLASQQNPVTNRACRALSFPALNGGACRASRSLTSGKAGGLKGEPLEGLHPERSQIMAVFGALHLGLSETACRKSSRATPGARYARTVPPCDKDPSHDGSTAAAPLEPTITSVSPAGAAMVYDAA